MSQVPELDVSNFNIVAATIGGFLTVFGLVSYLVKEKLYLSEALVSTVAGLIFSPHAANLIKPLQYAGGDPVNLDTITLYFTRLVLCVQLVLAGIQLPSKYLKKEWKSLSLLLGPGMCAMWISTSLLVWALVPKLSFLHALAVAACVTPTDPVLSNSIVKGKFADKNIPKELQKIIIAESGANDGLGYPFLFLALYLIKYTGDNGLGETGGAGKAMGYWFGLTWGYTIIMSILYGAVVGWIFKEALHWAEDRKFVDRESFLIFAISLSLFILGTAGMLGSDDVLACFIAGNVFTWDDWFRVETMDDSFQPTVDLLFNVAIFAWYGAICPWYSFAHNNVIPIYRLIFIGILVLLFRRLPIILLLHKRIHQIEEWRQAIFVGFFGPIGVSAIFYLYISLQFLREIQVDGQQRQDAVVLSEVFSVVVWFMAICSIVVHGLTIPLGKLGFHLPRTISLAISGDDDDDEDEPAPFHVREHAANLEHAVERQLPLAHSRSNRIDGIEPPRSLFKIGRAIIKDPREVRDYEKKKKKITEELSKNDSGRQTPPERRGPGTPIEEKKEKERAASAAESPENNSGRQTPPERRGPGTPIEEKRKKTAWPGSSANSPDIQSGNQTPLGWTGPGTPTERRTIRFYGA